ncbi:MAG: adenosylcobalamin-dependent ribonucleoside-diphosphate reductase [Planctomycetes bacterium]|nr:adenosylcobalamin-dependent ribonucleoside-diphosphate reductase [Planctomycetota bacterium]
MLKQVLPPRPDLSAHLADNALAVLRRRYLIRDEQGRPAETPEDLFWRVAWTVAQAESAYGGDAIPIAQRFYHSLMTLDFLPNSPTLMNAGRELGQLFACFVLPVADALHTPEDDGIFDTVRSTALIHQSGGGTGFSFSHLRPEGSLVRSSGGRASGPISFMRVYNAATEAISQGGFRRGANMGILRVDHPDILDFINIKSDPREMTNFNLSVAVTDDFLRAVRDDGPHETLDPHTGRRAPLRDKVRDDTGRVTGLADKIWSARELYDLICRRAWESGEPGIVFLDRVNAFNPTPHIGPMEATNPCGEQPLLPFEACNLASLNLGRFVADDESGKTHERIQWPRLAETVRLAVRFLDDVIDINRYPKPQIERIVKGNRKIGLGVMGWADMLFRLGIRYDGEEAFALGRTLMKFIREEGWKASMDLAQEREPFPNYPGSAYVSGHAYFNAPRPLRNATVTTIAPTGTISIIAGASGGIEPVFSIAFERYVMDGTRLVEVHPRFREIGRREGWYTEELARRIMSAGTARDCPEVPERWRDVFAGARDIPPEGHLRMQAAFQEFCDNAVSKTVNFPRDASPVGIRRVYDLAVEWGVKGVTVYRDGSRAAQPMQLAAGAERGLADHAPGTRYRYPTNLGTAHVIVTEDERGPREVFATVGKSGTDISALAQAIGRLISTALGYGVPPDEIARQLLGITSQPMPFGGGWVKSVPDAIGQALARFLAERKQAGPVLQTGAPTGGLCPDCGAPLVVESGCFGGKCLSCGFAKC